MTLPQRQIIKLFGVHELYLDLKLLRLAF